MIPNPAIVVVAYNRPQALKGLLDSLIKADYQGLEVQLVISIDGGGDKQVIALAESFNWPFGNKLVSKQPIRLGLKNHIVACGSFTRLFNSIILLEDDLEVAPGFYNFALHALKACVNEPIIAGISLYSYAISECTYESFKTYPDGHDTYLMQFPSSWGQLWTELQWHGFLSWLDNHDKQSHTNLPPFVQRWGQYSWKKLFLQYMIEESKYFLYPKQSFTTNKGYPGVHFALRLMLYDVPLNKGKELTQSSIENLQRFDAYFEMEPNTLKRLAGNELEDTFELNLFEAKDPNEVKAKYFIGPLSLLESKQLPSSFTKVIKSFSQLTELKLTPTKYYQSPRIVRVEEAEYYWRIQRGIHASSLIGKWFFIAKYNVFKHLNAIRQRLQ
jgi:glycosyltransferase involved in cell wall biosynthesis